jgi:hypothetical protein
VRWSTQPLHGYTGLILRQLSCNNLYLLVTNPCSRRDYIPTERSRIMGDTALNAIKRYVGCGSCYHRFPRISLLGSSCIKYTAVDVVARCGRGGVSSPVGEGCSAVLLVSDVLTPRDGTALLVGCLHRYMGHEVLGATPCQWSSPGSKNTRSPGRITSIGPPRRWQRPTPSVT